MDHPVSINIFDQIQSICRDFRHELKKGQSQSIEDFVERIDKSAQLNLFQNLLHIDIEFRRRNGEKPQSSDYSKRFPEFARLIRQAFFEDTMMSMDPMQDTPVVDSAEFIDPLNREASFDSLAHQQAAYAPMEMPAARRIGDYELIRELGRGGMGVVYEAKHLQRQNHVALKTLPTGVDGQEVNAERLHKFRNEFRSLSEINHPNLVGMQTLEVDGGQWFFTMDLIIGQDFLSYVRPKGQLDTDRLHSTLKQLATGIIFLHESGIVHRDLKPSNVLVDETGRVSLLDFGLVAELQQAADKSATLSTAHFVGTPRYAAPEQMFGERTQATDWYALGTMLYEALTGNPPFTGQPIELLKQKQSKEPPKLSDIQSLPNDLAILADGLLKREPALRTTTERIVETLNLGIEISSRGLQDSAQRSLCLAAEEPLKLDAPFDEEIVLIGREEQLDQLETAKLQFLKNREPMIVWITGKSGEGKSSLAEKFLHPIRQGNEMLVLSGRCYDRESVPYKAVDSIIDSLVRFLKSNHGKTYQSKLPEDIAILARLFPLLNRVEAIARVGRPDLEQMEPEKIRARAFYAFRELLTSISRRSPIVVLIDDLQWADGDSAPAIWELLDSAETPSILFLGSYRSDEADDSAFIQSWNQLAALRTSPLETQLITVDPLNLEQCIELVASRTGADLNTIGRQFQTFFAESGGNPYFVEQLMVGYDPAEQQFQHAALEEIIGRRLKQLPKAAKKLLDMVAVSGQPILVDEVSQAAELESTDLETLTHMRSERLVRLIGSADELLVETYHDKIRETILTEMSNERRRIIHLQLAKTIEAKEQRSAEQWHDEITSANLPGEYSQEVSERVSDLAHHYYESGDSKAFVYLMLAAEQALIAYAFEDAVTLYNRCEKLLPVEAPSSLQFRYWYSVGRVRAWEKEVGKSVAAFQQAIACAETDYCLAVAHHDLGYLLMATGRFDQSIIQFDESLRYLGIRPVKSKLGKLFSIAANSFRLLLIPATLQTAGNDNARRFAELSFWNLNTQYFAFLEKSMFAVLDINTRSAVTALRTGKSEYVALGYSTSGFLWSAVLGFGWIGQLFLQRSLRIEATTASPEILGQLATNRGSAAYWMGALPQAVVTFEAGISKSIRSGDFASVLVALHLLRHSYTYIGTTGIELATARDVLKYATAVDSQIFICWGNYDCAIALARRGDLEQAAEFMQTANSKLEGERFYQTEAIRGSTDGYLRLQCSDFENARLLAFNAWNTASKKFLLSDVTLFCLPVLIEALAGPRWKKPISRTDGKLLKKMMRRASILYVSIPNHQPHLLRVFGRAAMALGNQTKAIRKIEQAVKVAEQKGMKYQRAKCLLDLAAVKEENREENRAEAIELLKKMESVIPRAESWLLGDQYDEQVVAPEFDLEAWEKENGPVSNLENIQ